MKRFLFILLQSISGAALAAPDIDCLVERYSRYIDQHNEAFLTAAVDLEQRSPLQYEIVSEFIEYQIRSNTLKAYVVAYMGSKAPRQLLLDAALAKIVPEHETGAAHRIMMADQTYRDSYPEWRAQRDQYLQKSSYSEAEWLEFVAARNMLNRMLAATPQYPAVIAAFRTPVAELCQIPRR